jgi:IPT/TIG domain
MAAGPGAICERGGKGAYFSNVGSLGRGVLKKASDDRVKELLRVLNYLAAPFATQEHLLNNFGTGFTGATVVNFGSAPATNLQVISDTQLTAVSPAGTGRVNVTVTTPGGTSATSTTTGFSYQ